MKEALKLALEAIKNSHEYRIGNPAYEQVEAKIEEALAQPEQEPVAWPCVIAEADFSQDTVTLTMQCTDYKVSAGKHWLSTTPPQRTWIGLSLADKEEYLALDFGGNRLDAMDWAARRLKKKNT